MEEKRKKDAETKEKNGKTEKEEKVKKLEN